MADRRATHAVPGTSSPVAQPTQTADQFQYHALSLSGRMTVPQVFIDDTPRGGYDELVALDRSGELDALLGRD